MPLGLIEAKLLHFFLRNARFPISNKNIYTHLSPKLYMNFLQLTHESRINLCTMNFGENMKWLMIIYLYIYRQTISLFDLSSYP